MRNNTNNKTRENDEQEEEEEDKYQKTDHTGPHWAEHNRTWQSTHMVELCN